MGEAAAAAPGISGLARIVAFVRLGRPLFLGGGFVLYALGAAIAAWHGHAIAVSTYLLGQLVVTALQLMTHYANDYFDYEADCANLTPTRWSGGSRVLPSGEIPRRAALVAALLLAGIGVTAGLQLAAGAAAGVQVIALVLTILALSWAYSAPPLRLHSSGLGELDVVVVVTGLVPLLGFTLQAPDRIGLRTLLLAVAPLVCLQLAMLLAIEFPDEKGDRATGKRTLVVRLSPARAVPLYAGITLAAYAILPILVVAGLPFAVAAAAAVTAPVAAWRLWRVRAGDCLTPARWESLTFWAVALLVATSAAELVAFVVLLRAN
jgi:1,4-dihydroxy-2-naphthoate octaprenyltransferase